MMQFTFTLKYNNDDDSITVYYGQWVRVARVAHESDMQIHADDVAQWIVDNGPAAIDLVAYMDVCDAVNNAFHDAFETKPRTIDVYI